MIIVGIHADLPISFLSGKPQCHDSNVSLIKDGVYLGSVQQERFSRKKFDGSFPHECLHELLKRNKLSSNDVNVVTLIRETYVKNPLNDNDGSVDITNFLRTIFANAEIKFLDHHVAHSMGAFLTSNYDECNLLSIDGAGSLRNHLLSDNNGSALLHQKTVNWGFFGIAKNNPFDLLKLSELNHYHNEAFFDLDGNIVFNHPKSNKLIIASLGSFYSVFSHIIYQKLLKKFKIDNKFYHKDLENIAGKIMGLQGYGKYVKELPEFLSVDLYSNYDLPTIFYNFSLNDYYKNYLENMEPEDISLWLQQTFEKAVIKYLKLIPSKFKKDKLCLSGGCALNILLNSKIIEEGIYKNLHIHPSTSDSGLSIGAALLTAKELDVDVKIPKNIGCVGLDYDNNYLKSISIIKNNQQLSFFELLQSLKLKCEEKTYNEIYDITSSFLKDNKIVGWFQGRSEYGPRALGNRSILANPSYDNKTHLNEKVKVREFWRPYAAVVLKEYQNEWFNITKQDSFYMLFSSTVKDDKIDQLPSITHIDKTCRIQTVTEDENNHLYNLLLYFNDKTKIPILLNTSFNTIKGEPIVETPVDAVKSFVNSKMDVLILNNLIITKENV